MPDRLTALRNTHAEIVESDGGECELMSDVRFALNEIERLRGVIEEALPWLEKAAPLLNTSAPWERLRDALKG